MKTYVGLQCLGGGGSYVLWEFQQHFIQKFSFWWKFSLFLFQFPDSTSTRRIGAGPLCVLHLIAKHFPLFFLSCKVNTLCQCKLVLCPPQWSHTACWVQTESEGDFFVYPVSHTFTPKLLGCMKGLFWKTIPNIQFWYTEIYFFSSLINTLPYFADV